MPNLKKCLYFTICNEEIIVNVDWSLLEKVERVYNMRAETVAVVLQNDMHVPRTKVAAIVELFVQGLTKLKRDDIKEHFFTISQVQVSIEIGKIQAAILWSIRGQDGNPMITDEQFEALASGTDIEVEEKEAPKGDAAVSKKPRGATSKRRSG